jgi:hypothetical protein
MDTGGMQRLRAAHSRAILALSLAINVALLAMVLLPDRQPAWRYTSGKTDADSIRLLAADAVRSGAPRQVADMVALSVLQNELSPRTGSDYWRSMDKQESRRTIETIESRQHVRSVLLEAFGSDAAKNPIFARVFHPFSPRLDFVSAEHQAQIENQLLQDARARIDARAPFIHVQPGSAEDEYLSAAARKVLDDAQLREYELRHSITSQNVASSGFEFTEEEFRRTMTVILDGEKNAAGIDDGLARALGASRYAEFSRTHDPIYRYIELAASKRGISDSSVQAAYSAIEAANRSLSQRPRKATLAVASIYSERDRILVKELGAELFAEIEAMIGARSRPPVQAASTPRLRNVIRFNQAERQ